MCVLVLRGLALVCLGYAQINIFIFLLLLFFFFFFLLVISENQGVASAAPQWKTLLF